MNGGDLDSALGLLNGPGVDANGNLLQQKSSWKKEELERFKVERWLKLDSKHFFKY